MCTGVSPDQTIISGSVQDSLRWAHQELVNRGKRHQRDSKRRANRCDTRGAGTAQSRAHSDFMAADLIHQFITGLPTETGIGQARAGKTNAADILRRHLRAGAR